MSTQNLWVDELQIPLNLDMAQVAPIKQDQIAIHSQQQRERSLAGAWPVIALLEVGAREALQRLIVFVEVVPQARQVVVHSLMSI